MSWNTGRLAIALILLTTWGCSLHRPLAHHAVSYNKTIEEAHNEVLLLNILRAKNRMPMHFTSISGITTGVGYSVDSGKLTLTDLASSAISAVTATQSSTTKTDFDSDTRQVGLPSFSYSNKPTAQVVVHDGQKFIRGILAPVSPRTVFYYWQQGWKPDLLIYLLVEEIEISKAEVAERICPGVGINSPIVNDPENPTKFRQFRQCVDSFLASNCRLSLTSRINPLLAGSNTKRPSPAELLKAYELGLTLSGTGEDGYQLGEVADGLKLTCPKDEKGEIAVFNVDSERGAKSGDDVHLNIVFRSPQGLIYYLGEIARMWEDGRYDQIPKIYTERQEDGASGIGSSWTPLFVLRDSASPCREAVLQEDYLGKTYFIPRDRSHPDEINQYFCNSGRSTQAITLAAQLISMQREGEDLPGPTLVRVVGE